jgi:hypothetical protein
LGETTDSIPLMRMPRSITAWGGLLCFLTVTAGPATAGPVLLGSFTQSGAMGHTGMSTPHAPVTEQVFLLSYSGTWTDLEDPENGIPLCIGCSTAVPVGWTGTLQFDSASEGPRLSAFLTRLTNNADEPILFGGLYRNSSAVLGGGFGDLFESQALATPSVLRSWDVDFVRVSILTNEVIESSTTSFVARPSYTWEFWGTADAVVPPTPVPDGSSSLWIMGLGITALTAMRLRTTTGRH